LRKADGYKKSEAEEIVRKAKKHGRILMVGFNRRYMPIFQRAKQEFESPNHIDVCKAEMCQDFIS
jgi:predicted dehydrogenase